MDLKMTISNHVRNVSHNYETFIKYFPKTYLAAEEINDIFDQLYSERLLVDQSNLIHTAISKMLFGTHLAWINSFYLNAAGQQDIGRMSERKAIEYVCYISKISGSSRRAKLWYNRMEEIKYEKRFSNEFSIPSRYFTAKYEVLAPLLVEYDHISEYVVHGNLTSLTTKFVGDENNITTMTFQDLPDWIPHASVISTQIGSFIIDALMNYLKDYLKDYDDFSEKIKVKDTLIRDAKIEVYKHTDGDKINLQIMKSIINNDMEGINKLYEKLKDKYSKNATQPL